jgi:MFS family permease
MTRIEKFSLLLLIPSASILATFISPELGLIKAYFFVSSKHLSLVMTYYLIGNLLGQGFWGYLSTLMGRGFSIRVGTFTGVIGALILLYAFYGHSYNSFIIARMIMGFGLSSGLICGYTIIKENLPPKAQKKFITLVTIFFTASIYTSIALSGHLLQYTSLDIVIWALLFIGLCFFVLSFFISSRTNQPIGQTVKNNHGMKFKEIAPTVIYSLVLSITTIITYLYAFYAPLITSQLFSFSPQIYSTYSFINLFFILIGSYLFPYLNRNLSEYSLCIYGLLLIILSSLTLIVVYSSLQPMFVSFFLCSYLMDFMLGIIYPAATVMALEYGRNKATTSAIMNTIKLSLPIIAIYFSSRFFQNKLYGFSFTIVLCSSTFLLSLIFLETFFKQKNHPIIA